MNKIDITLLIVDDDEMIRDSVAAYLDDEGFTVHVEDSGEAALAIIAELKPAVCISDFRLTGMNGEEFILKAHLISPETAYLLHTGMPYPLSDELHKIGMSPKDVLLKPIHDLSLLVDVINNSVASRRKP